MKVLVTGVAGYIGGQTALQLKDAGHVIHGIDCRSLPDHLSNTCDLFLKQDFASDIALDWIKYHRPDAIIHCAGTSLVGPSVTNPTEYYENNFVKTKRLCDSLLQGNTDIRIIFSSSAATYGNPIMTPCQEVDPTEPISPYGESKLMVEWLMKSYNHAYGLNYVAIRYFNACGADPQARHGQEPGATHIIARILENTLAGKDFVCNGNNFNTDDGTCVRDYVHVSDIADAHILALNSSVPSGIYNLGTSTGASNLEVIEAARSVVHLPINVVFGPKRDGDPAMLTADAGKFNEVTGWKPKFTLHDIIQHVWAWYTK